jgi:hypothetical protein
MYCYDMHNDENISKHLDSYTILRMFCGDAKLSFYWEPTIFTIKYEAENFFENVDVFKSKFKLLVPEFLKFITIYYKYYMKPI